MLVCATPTFLIGSKLVIKHNILSVSPIYKPARNAYRKHIELYIPVVAEVRGMQISISYI